MGFDDAVRLPDTRRDRNLEILFLRTFGRQPRWTRYPNLASLSSRRTRGHKIKYSPRLYSLCSIKTCARAPAFLFRRLPLYRIVHMKFYIVKKKFIFVVVSRVKKIYIHKIAPRIRSFCVCVCVYASRIQQQ